MTGWPQLVIPLLDINKWYNPHDQILSWLKNYIFYMQNKQEKKKNIIKKYELILMTNTHSNLHTYIHKHTIQNIHMLFNLRKPVNLSKLVVLFI